MGIEEHQFNNFQIGYIMIPLDRRNNYFHVVKPFPHKHYIFPAILDFEVNTDTKP